MIRRLVFSALAAAVILASGCNMFKKSKQPKENSAISSEVEADFRRRWVDKRVSELTAQGVAADAATTQADREFRERYVFTRPAGK